MVQLRDIFLASLLVGCTGKSIFVLFHLHKIKMCLMKCVEHPVWSGELSSVTEGLPFSSRVAPLPSSESAVW